MVSWTHEQHVAHQKKHLAGKGGRHAPLIEEPVPKMTDEQKLNKTERHWLSILRGRNCEWIGIQNVTLKLAFDMRYTPDFVVRYPGELPTAYEVKGFMRDDALVKLKTAARLFPWLTFVLVQRRHGVFSERRVMP